MTPGRPRVLAIMGSGETAPTMGKVHRALVARMPASSTSAVMLDTPFGFQENADVITAKAQDYFAETVGQELGLASFRSRASAAADPLAHEQMLLRVRDADYVFAGPGSPSYALAQWADSALLTVLGDKLRPGGTGGVVTFASAAAITLGPLAIPVYEIYKVGAPPHWLEGLDLLAETGLRAVVVPHFNNAEGGNHDTRFCYLGERRLALLEELLPEDVFVLGVDEHTACILDLEAGTAEVAGIGQVTVRRRGTSETFAAGNTVGIEELASAALHPGRDRSAERTRGTVEPGSPDEGDGTLLDDAARCEKRFDEALADGDAAAATAVVLELSALLAAWAGDTTQSDHLARGGASLRTLVVRLGQAAETGLSDPRHVVGPYVKALLSARDRARAERRWDEADRLRSSLTDAGVEVRDTPNGSEWSLS